MSSMSLSRGIITTELDNLSGADAVGFVQHIEALGYDSLWVPELFGREPMATAGYLLAKTDRIKIASGIANIYVRDAHSMVQSRHTLAELSEGRFILGLGVSNVGLNQARGHTWQPPVAKMAGYLDAMAAVEVGSVAPKSMGPLYMAAHGPKMQALGASRTDGVLTYLMSPEHTQLSKARMGPDADLNVICFLLAETDPAKARQTAREALAFYMGLDYYHREWRKLGFSDSDFTDGGSDALIDMLVGWGDTETMQAHVKRHEEAGATRVIIAPLAYGKSGLSRDNPLFEALAPGS
jgi:probable F420-dependent oxidoreductase